MTWPVMRGLLQMIQEYPPADLLVSGFLKQMGPKPIDQQMGAFRFKKGKVRKR